MLLGTGAPVAAPPPWISCADAMPEPSAHTASHVTCARRREALNPIVVSCCSSGSDFGAPMPAAPMAPQRGGLGDSHTTTWLGRVARHRGDENTGNFPDWNMGDN